MTSTALLSDGEPLCVDADVEALLWAERVRAAEAWELFAESCVEWDASSADVGPVARDAMLALESWVGAQLRREELLYEWEQAGEQIAKWQAVQVCVLARALDLALSRAVSGSDADLEVRDLAAELACAVGLSDRTVQRQMDDAVALRDRFPATLVALGAGSFSRAHAQVIVEEGCRLPGAERAAYERLVLERVHGLTAGRLRTVAKSIAEGLMPTSIAERHTEARPARCVTVRDLSDGMAELNAVLPAVLAHGIHDRLTRMGRVVKDAERDVDETGASAAPVELRILDQLRADILCDLVLTGHATAAGIDRDGAAAIDGIQAIVQVTVPVQTLIGDDRAGSAASLADRCPIDPETARHLAGSATLWDRILTDPVTGDVLAVDRRFPTEAQRRHLRARDEHCRFPGCRMPVWRCDVDHTIDHQHGGPTEPGNLAHLCRRHHTLKHETAWTVEQHDHGVLIWTSPAGRVYGEACPPNLRFVPHDAPAATLTRE